MVGKGPLEAAVKAELNRLSGLYDKFSYIHLKGCSYAEMQYLQNMADVYLMLHRISIFDLTTLEMMDKSKCVVLSDVGEIRNLTGRIISFWLRTTIMKRAVPLCLVLI